MNQIKRKLHSKQGASLLIAMVYLIFAVFIGGSVLAAASANGYRIEHLSDQQDYLNQRSAALLLADQMELDTFAGISLDAKYATVTRQRVILHPKGEIYVVGDERVSHVLTFEANNNGKMDALHRAMYEAAVLRYLEENKDRPIDQIVLQDFVYDDGSSAGQVITSMDNFWTPRDSACSGSIHITGTKDGEIFTDYTARYSCGKGENLYDFLVDFGEFSQITITMDGYSSMRLEPGALDYESVVPEANEEKPAEGQLADSVIAITERTSIAWSSPVIHKGGTE